MATTWATRTVRVTYVLAVAVLAGIAWGHDHSGFDPIEATALALVMPAVVPALPVIYFVGAIAWRLSGAPDNGPMWPVAVTFAVLLGACACINLLLLRAWSTRRRARRQGHSQTSSVA